MESKIRFGIIGRSDLGGLGIETKYFCKWMKPTKVMIVKIGKYQSFPENYPGAMVVDFAPTDEQIREFCKDIDVLFAFETPYNWNSFKIAKEMGVKTGMFIDYEWTPLPFIAPDVIINPSNYHMDDLPLRTVHITFPVDRGVHPFLLRTKATRFLHIVGHGGGYGRNGTKEFLEAIKLVKNPDIKFIIHSQIQIDKINDPRIEWRVGNYLNEAMSHGLAIIMSDMNPQNQFLPKELLIHVFETTKIKIAREIELGFISPQAIAEKIEQIAGKDITKYSKYSDKWAESISWETLKPKILQLFE